MSGDVILYREWLCRACGWVTPKRKHGRKPKCPVCTGREKDKAERAKGSGAAGDKA